MRVFHDDGIGERNIEAIFYDCSTRQYVGLVAHEVQHRPFQLGFAHLPVPNRDSRIRNQLLDLCGPVPDGVHAIVEEVYLPTTPELELEGSADHFRMERRDYGMNR